MADIYDSAFHTIINDCKKFLIPYINEVFGEDYSGDEEIVFHPNEHYISRNNEPDVKRITDSDFSIIGSVTKNYHLECESNPYDASILARLFEYDAQIALDSATIDGDIINVSFPNTAVLYLRSGRNMPDCVLVHLIYPGGDAKYSVPAVYLQSYSLDDIFKKKLYIMLPFYLFNYEKRLDEIECDEAKLDALTEEYNRIVSELSGLVATREITAFDIITITDLMEKVFKALVGSREHISERIGGIMGGQVIMTKAKEILNSGIEQGIERGIEQGIERGIERGIEQGIEQGRIQMVVDLVNDEVLSIEEAAARVGLTVEEFKKRAE